MRSAAEIAAGMAALQLSDWPAHEISAVYVASGESYDAWKIEDRGGERPALLLRRAHRAVQDLAQPPRREYEALRDLEHTGLAARVWDYDDGAGNPLGAPYVVTTFVEGDQRDPREWSQRNLADLARRAALVHNATARPGTSSGIAWYENSLAWWQENHPEAVAEPAAARLLHRVRAFVAEREETFERLTELVLVHGDLVATNVLFRDDRPCFVDWEWADADDPARDLALIGGQSYGGPWYVPLDDDAVETFVAVYAGERGWTDESAVGGLMTRRDVWMALDRTFSSLHFRLGENAEKHAAAEQMEETLLDFLRR